MAYRNKWQNCKWMETYSGSKPKKLRFLKKKMYSEKMLWTTGYVIQNPEASLEKRQGLRVKIQLIIRGFLQKYRRRVIGLCLPLDLTWMAEIRSEGRERGLAGRRGRQRGSTAAPWTVQAALGELGRWTTVR